MIEKSPWLKKAGMDDGSEDVRTKVSVVRLVTVEQPGREVAELKKHDDMRLVDCCCLDIFIVLRNVRMVMSSWHASQTPILV